MGRDKALLQLDGETLVRRTSRVLEPLFERVLVVTNQTEVARAAQIPFINDSVEGKGPLGGIEAALSHFGDPTFFVTCDAPFVCPDFIAFQCEKWRDELDALAAQSENGIEPLHAIWSPSCLPWVRQSLEKERPPSLRRMLGELKTGVLDVEDARRFDPLLRCFENWNTPDDVRNAG